MRLSVLCLQLAGRLVPKLEPAYLVHPRIETIEADVQGYHWTGCRIVEGVPNIVRERETSVDLSLFEEQVRRSIIVSREFEHPIPPDTKKVKKGKRRPPHSYPPSLLRHLLFSVISRAPSYPHLKDLHLAQGLKVSGSWQTHGQRLAVTGHPGDMFLSRNPLPPLFSPEEAESAVPVATPTRDLFADLEQWGTREWCEERAVGEEEEEEGRERGLEGVGMKEDGEKEGSVEREGEREMDKETIGTLDGSREIFPHLHTMFMVSTHRLWEVQQIQRGLIFSFTRLLSEAVRDFGSGVLEEGVELPHPLCGQCVLTDGQKVTLLWLQVNSLFVGHGEEGRGGGGGGGKNLVAVERLGPLYKTTDMLEGRKRRIVEGFDENVLRTLLATLLMT